MTTTTKPPPAPLQELARIGRATGFLIAAGINVVLIFVVTNLLGWGFPSFLTEDFAQLEPLIVFSLGLTAAANVIYALADSQLVKRSGDIVTSLVSMLVTVRILQVFPFDYSAYEFNWAALTRVVLIFVIVATGVTVLVAVAKLSRRALALDGVQTLPPR